jgi:hypothetical protein
MTKGKRYHGVNRYLIAPGGVYPMTSGKILERFGLKPGHPIPPDYRDQRVIEGVLVEIRPKTRKGMEKRVFARCPECSVYIEAGHLHQHVEARHA